MSPFALIQEARSLEADWARNEGEAIGVANDLADALEAALEGLYRVYVNLGEDTDGACNARELFGPWVGFDPATHIPEIATAFRKQSEEDYEADLEKAYDEGVEIGRYYGDDMTFAPLSPYRWRSKK